MLVKKLETIFTQVGLLKKKSLLLSGVNAPQDFKDRVSAFIDTTYSSKDLLKLVAEACDLMCSPDSKQLQECKERLDHMEYLVFRHIEEVEKFLKPNYVFKPTTSILQ